MANIGINVAPGDLSLKTPQIAFSGQFLLVGVSVLALTGAAPSLAMDKTIPIASATVSLAGQAPTATVGTTAAVAQPAAGSATFAGLAPSVSVGGGVLITPAAGNLRFKGPGGPSPVFVPDPAALALTGQSVVTAYKLVSIPQGALVFTGQAPTALNTPKGVFSIPTGVLTLTGQYVGQGFGTILPDDLVLTGYAPNLNTGFGPKPNTAALTLTGLAPTRALITNVQSPAPAALALDGQTPTVLTFGLMLPARAALVLAGQIPQVVIGAVTSPTYTPPTQALALTGYAPDIASDRAFAVPAAALALTGQLPTRLVFGLAQTVAVPAGALTCSTASPPTLKYFYVVSPAPARLRLLGPDPEMAGIQFGAGKMNYGGWQSVVNSSG